MTLSPQADKAEKETADRSKQFWAVYGWRMLTAFVLLPLVLYAIWSGGAAFALLVMLAIIVMAVEWGRMTQVNRPGLAIGLLILLLLLPCGVQIISGLAGSGSGADAPVATMPLFTIPFSDMPILGWSDLPLFLSGGLVWLCSGLVALLLVRFTGITTAALLGGFLYIGLPVMAVLALRGGGSGFGTQGGAGVYLVLYLSCLVWANDSAAMISGRCFGKQKLAPAISPGKTRAGFIGGIIAAGCVSVLFALFVIKHTALPNMPISMSMPMSMPPAIVMPIQTRLLAALAENGYFAFFIGVLCGLLAQIGDLGESWIKRYYNVRHSGRFLPGHGGLLDRVDGLGAVYMVAFIVLLILGGRDIWQAAPVLTWNP